MVAEPEGGRKGMVPVLVIGSEGSGGAASVAASAWDAHSAPLEGSEYTRKQHFPLRSCAELLVEVGQVERRHGRVPQTLLILFELRARLAEP